MVRCFGPGRIARPSPQTCIDPYLLSAPLLPAATRRLSRFAEKGGFGRTTRPDFLRSRWPGGSSFAHHRSRFASSRDVRGAMVDQAALDGFETLSPNGRSLGRTVRPGKRGRRSHAGRMD